MLGDHSRAYEVWKMDDGDLKNKPKIGYYEFTNLLPSMKSEKDFLKNGYSQSLQSSVKNLSGAFDRFFKGDSKYPTFKKRKN